MLLDTQKHKELLLKEKTRLEADLSGISVQNPHDPAEWDAKPENETEEADLNVAADIHEDVEERHGVSDELEKELLGGNTALARIEEGVYGACSVCGGEIEEARLLANPAAATCTAHMGN